MSKRPITRLVFVFDADSGFVGALVDSARKVLHLRGCPLCSLTHGVTGERAAWRSCKEEIGVPIDYYHRDDVPESMRPVVGELPCVLAEVEGARHELLLPRSSLAECRGSVAELNARIFIRALSKGLALAGANHGGNPGEIPKPGA